jgi:hypothetical protein
MEEPVSEKMSYNNNITIPKIGNINTSIKNNRIEIKLNICTKIMDNIINIKSIDVFIISNENTKNNNDKNNKLRERIICDIINKKIPENYYLIPEWVDLKNKLFHFISELIGNRFYINIECEPKGGRKFNYDFKIKITFEDNTKEEFNIEFKFNLTTISGAPQFVSPMKPSQYMSQSFEEYYHDNFLLPLSSYLNIDNPNKEVYLKQIHSPSPKCMKVYQEKYYKGCKGNSKFTNKEEDIKFYKLSKKISEESIKLFIENTELNIDLLTHYLIKSQKIRYICYIQKVDLH